MHRIVIFASGEGTNAENLIKHSYLFSNLKICGILTNNPKAPVIEKAKKNKIPHYLIDPENNLSILDLLDNIKPNWALLAGYMKILPSSILNYFKNPFLYKDTKIQYKIFNIHPSLLPSYPGIGAIKKSYQNKEKIVGVTIHFVDEGLDTGPIFLQKKIYVTSEMELDFNLFKQTIHNTEYELYPKVLEWINQQN